MWERDRKQMFTPALPRWPWWPSHTSGCQVSGSKGDAALPTWPALQGCVGGQGQAGQARRTGGWEGPGLGFLALLLGPSPSPGPPTDRGNRKVSERGHTFPLL
jgi:hypothetical protein